MKRKYHPLVLWAYYSGTLSAEQLQHIPYTTRKYWDSVPPQALFGFAWVEQLCLEQQHFSKLTRHRIVFRAARACCTVLDCFSQLFCQKRGYKSILRRSKPLVLRAIDSLSRNIPLVKACKIFQLSTRQYYRWKQQKICAQSPIRKCFRAHPAQLSRAELTSIEAAIDDPENFQAPLATVYFGLMHAKKLCCSLSTFYRYAAFLRALSPKKCVPPKPEPFRASRVFEYLHIDTTFCATKEGVRGVAFVRDNKSKAILHKLVLGGKSSRFIRDLLDAAFQKYGLYEAAEPVCVVSDGGTENKGEVLAWIGGIRGARVTKVIARKEVPFSNAMSESLHHLFKTFFAPDKVFEDEAHLQQQLDEFEHFINYRWFPIEFHGLHPVDILQGAEVDKSMFREQLERGKRQRLVQNRSFSCLPCTT